MTTASFTVTDGDPRTDEDGIADGIINDPSGPAITIASGEGSSSIKKTDEYTCKNSTALNFSNTGTHKDSLCVYEESVVTPTPTEPTNLGAGEQCSSSQLLTQNMKAGDRNGRYSS